MTSVVDYAASADAYAELRAEFVDALREDPTRVIKTPEGAYPEDTVAQVIFDDLQDVVAESYEDFESLLRVVTYSAFKSTDPETRLVALTWIDAASKRHGERHKDARLIENAKGGRS